jgi:hypothetical protein
MSALAKKLVEVMAAVERIPKNGWNAFHQYHYATEADTAEAIRSELSQRGVLLLPAITGTSREPVGEKGSVLTHLTMEFTFMDSETGETITRPWLGAGTDKEDKGAYKAMTGGEKYFLLKTFLIPTGDDPEAESAESQKTASRRVNPDGGYPPIPKPLPPPPSPPAQRPTPKPPTAAPLQDGCQVVNVKELKGVKNGKPWTMWAVKFSDGREAATFSASTADLAEDAKRMALVLHPVITETNGKKKLEALDRAAS